MAPKAKSDKKAGSKAAKKPRTARAKPTRATATDEAAAASEEEAPPRAVRARARATEQADGEARPDAALDLAHRVSRLMLERGAEQVSVLNVGKLTSFADYFVLATAQSDRQVQAIARFLAETLKREGHPALSTEGEEQSHWVLMDFGGVVAHIFFEPARNYYDLDGLWADAPRVVVEDTAAALKAAARRMAAASGEEPAPKKKGTRARGTSRGA